MDFLTEKFISEKNLFQSRLLSPHPSPTVSSLPPNLEKVEHLSHTVGRLEDGLCHPALHLWQTSLHGDLINVTSAKKLRQLMHADNKSSELFRMRRKLNCGQKALKMHL